MTQQEHVPGDESGTVAFPGSPTGSPTVSRTGPPTPPGQAAADADRSGSPDPGDLEVVVPDDPMPAPADQALPAPQDELSRAVARLTEDDLAPTERRRAIGQVAAALRARGFKDLFRPRAAMGWLADVVVDVAPRTPLRSLTTLRSHFPGLDDEEIAGRLVRNAARTTAGIGAIGGGVASIEWAAPPALLTAPVLLAAETVAVVAVEIKLIGELQELHGQPVPGTGTQRAITLLQAWAGRRGVSLMVPGRGMAVALGSAARHELRDRLLRRFGRNLTTLGPLLTGAAVAAYLNRRATLKLAEEVRSDLARQLRQVPRQLRPE